MLQEYWKNVDHDDRCNKSSHTNYHFLDMSEKEERLHKLQTKTKVCQQRVKYLRERVNSLIQQKGLHGDLVEIMLESYPPDYFPHIFWEQQHCTAKLHNLKSMK